MIDRDNTDNNNDDAATLGDINEQDEQQTGDNTEEQQDETGADEEIVVSIGDETPEPVEDKAPDWVRELRKSHRELTKRNRELEEKLNASSNASTKPVAVGNKPKLEDFDYDTDKFEQELESWYNRKREADSAAAKAEEEAKKQQQAWQEKLDNYGKLKAELKIKDFDEAEAAAQDILSVTQQGIIVKGAKNPALVICALGNNQKKAKELAAITDPIEFAFEIANLETQLKVTNRKAPPPPEKPITGTGRTSGSVDSTLDRLRAEADRTGDFSKVMEYKRQKRQSA